MIIVAILSLYNYFSTSQRGLMISGTKKQTCFLFVHITFIPLGNSVFVLQTIPEKG